jgi:ketosteroid isomerase-like protein
VKAFTGQLFSFKKWQIEIKKTAAVANGVPIGYHLCKSEPVIPINVYAR